MQKGTLEHEWRDETSEPRSLSRLDSVGGCILVSSATVLLEAIALSQCRASGGAGIGVTSSTVRVTEASFSHNGVSSRAATLLMGAAGYFEESTIALENCVFDSNFFGIASGNINGGALSFARSNVTLGGNIAVSSTLITKNEGGTIQGGSPLISAMFFFLFFFKKKDLSSSRIAPM